MIAPPTLICQMGRMGVHLQESLAPMRMRIVRVDNGCVRAFMSDLTWHTICADNAALKLFWDTLLDYPDGLTHLFGEDYRRAATRMNGGLPMEGWFAEVDNQL